MRDDNHKYDDIIDMPHHVSSTHPHMSDMDRAAQFSPFAALTGYDDAVKETARLTEQRIELDEYEKEKIDSQLQYIKSTLPESQEIVITHFEKDALKDGGSYVMSDGHVKKIDEYENLIIMNDGEKINIYDIVKILIKS